MSKMFRASACPVAVAAILAAAPAAAQAPGKDIFKGKVKEGLYEVKTDVDLTGVPGLAKEGQRSSETKHRCVTREEVDGGMEAGKDCQVKSHRDSAAGANVVMECKDGTTTDMKFTFSPGKFTTEMRTSGKQDGKSFVSVFRSQAKHVGPCPETPRK